MKKVISEKNIVALLLSCFFVFFLMLAMYSEATYDAGDGIRHYLIARYSWGHPLLFLDSWGKPIFTLICSPFAQFGLIGAIFFNILCGVGAAYYAYKICKKLNFDYAWLAVPFVLFMTGYFPTLNSGLTEPFFSLLLITAIYNVLISRFLLSSILISFLPLVRTEGVLILPLFLLILLYRKEFKSILFLGTGVFIYSLIGLFYFGDFFWIITQNPYNGANRDFYGSGELLHFVKYHNYIFGTTLLILLLGGIAGYLKYIYVLKKTKVKVENTYLAEEIVLILGSFVIYFVVHSIMWWKGWANSLGLLRVIAAVLPCASIIAVRGLNLFLIPQIKKNRIVANSIITITLLLILRSPFKHDYFPFRLDNEQRLINEAGMWFKSSAFTKQKIYYLYPYLAHVLNVDSFDPTKVGELWGLYPTIKKDGIGAVPDSTIVFWDSHFGPNECRIPLDSIYIDPNFKLIKTFKPVEEFNTLGGNKFEIYVFMKLSKPGVMKELYVKKFDFEVNNNFVNENLINNIKPYSGQRSCSLNKQDEYSVTINQSASEVPKNTTQVIFKAKIWTDQKQDLSALAVFSIDDANKKNILWDGKKIEYLDGKDELGWKTISIKYNLNSIYTKQPTNSLIFYIWNKDKQLMYLDDFEIIYMGLE
jgi:hypothetical protein